MKYYVKRVYEGTLIVGSEDIFIKDSISKYFNSLCIGNFSTFDGRINALKNRYGYKTLTPLYVSSDLIFFPTMSPRNYDCLWINYFAVKEIRDEEVVLVNEEIIEVKQSVLKMQFKRFEEIVF